MGNRAGEHPTETLVVRFHDESGISMLWVAVVAFFVMGAAALAVDTSGAMGAARTDQTTADLACLAAAKELPDSNDAFNTAAAYIDANWPAMTGATLSISGTTATYADGSGNSVFMDAAHGSGDAMYIHITEVTETSFGGAIGANSMTVAQEAACSGQQVRTGIGMVPIGVLAGAWNGDLFDCAKKVTGNCGALAPDGGGANAYRDAVANGIDGNFLKHHGNKNVPDPHNGYVQTDCFADPCNTSKTEPGNMVGPWNQGLTTRFTGTGEGCTEDGWFNCDGMSDVFPDGFTAMSGMAKPSWWENSIYGDFDVVKNQTSPDAKHWYYNGDGMICLSPRLVTVPVVNKNMNWDIGDSAGSWPNGRKDMKFIGFYTVFIREPSHIADIGGPMDADVIWFGPDAACGDTGEAFQPFGSTVEVDAGVRLVSP